MTSDAIEGKIVNNQDSHCGIVISQNKSSGLLYKIFKFATVTEIRYGNIKIETRAANLN